MRRLRTFAALATAALTAVGVVAAGAAPAFAGGIDHSSRHGPSRLPAHVAAPYFETFLGDSLAGSARASGARYLTLAFLQTAEMGSCTVSWNGDPTTPVSWSVYGSDIAKIRAAGGDVVPSFGGFAADSTGTEIADSCTDVQKIAAVYEHVITTYGVTRLDFDVEVNPGGGTSDFPEGSLGNLPGIARRNQAIRIVEDWARRTHRTVQFVYTLPTTAHGLAPDGLYVLQNAAQEHARIDIVNIMTFDYYDETPSMPGHEMAVSTITAADGLQAQLHSVYPRKSRAQLWHMTGITEMVGIDDFGPEETFTTADAVVVAAWAKWRGIALLSFWALQRDNGGCVGTAGSNTCSGIAQPAWYFTHVFNRFASHRGWHGSPPTIART